ncbi:Crp/Fnr family transcriptional regulator [Bacillus sp. FJAT-45350]|uniref:Crp/Fnr family transcriptional regulator n=1 Tax=Bacillus sp. FJAT-45350 TaxID=2011014 RepID=UPI000BB78BC0|nr:Crp/Fnr family transcriptional regulator [Bacillus sp. FJAT-45350]
MQKSLHHKWEPFLKYGRKKFIKKNTVLFHQEDIGDGFYYLNSGEVIIKLNLENGDERIIDFVTSSELFGEQGIKSDPYFATSIANTSCVIYYFSNDTFKQMCKDNPKVSELVMLTLIKKVRLYGETVSLLETPIEYQLSHLLHKLYQKRGSFEITLNQTALARYIGTSRITIYKILKKWKESGIITIIDRKIIITDIEKLKSIL